MRKREIEAIKKEVEIMNDLNHPKREIIFKKWQKDMNEINRVCKKRIEKNRRNKI